MKTPGGSETTSVITITRTAHSWFKPIRPMLKKSLLTAILRGIAVISTIFAPMLFAGATWANSVTKSASLQVSTETSSKVEQLERVIAQLLDQIEALEAENEELRSALEEGGEATEDSEAPGSSPIQSQTYGNMTFQLTGSELSGGTITFSFNIINQNAQDTGLYLAGDDYGYNDFFGFYSELFAGGIKYIASAVSLAGQSSEHQVYVVVPGGGQAVAASLTFEGLPSTIEEVDTLNVGLNQSQDKYPNDALSFREIPLTSSP